MYKRILLANEAGTGRGHLTTLKVFAEALGPSFVYDAALCRLHHAADIAPLCDRVFQGAALSYQPAAMALRQGRPIGNWAEFLASIGFASESFLVRQIDWWVRTIQSRCSNLVVAEFAPCAMLAARALGVPVISIGQGHSTPPSGMRHFPLPAGGQAALVHEEANLVQTVNLAGSRFGLPELAYFSDVYRCDLQVPRTIADLDPYADWRGRPAYLPPLGLDCVQVGSGNEIFVYFSTNDCNDPLIIEALTQVDLPMRVVMPFIDPTFAGRLSSRGVVIERQPLPHRLVAERSRMIVHAGQHGAVCMGLAFGLPQIALPGQAEQWANARRIDAMGSLRHFARSQSDPASVAAAISAAYHDVGMHQRARDLARALRPVLVGDTSSIVRGIVSAVLGGVVA